MNNNIEVYANITNFPNYQVSTFGNVKNVKTERILKPGTEGGGYLYVILTDDGKQSTKKIHRLVASAFLENQENKKNVDHIDRCKTNNHLSNLRFATDSENQQNKSFQSNNKSGVIGVSWYKSSKKWSVHIQLNGVQKHLGYFINIEDAKTARSNAEIQYFKDFRAIIPV